MDLALREHFAQQVESGTPRRGVRRLLEYPLRTSIGRKLLDDFAQSGGTINYQKEIERRARGLYSPSYNHIDLSFQATSTTVVHELAHARQFRKAPELFCHDTSATSAAHQVVLLEADSWALSAIFMKQFLAEHIGSQQDMDEFISRQKRSLASSVHIVPYRSSESKRLTSWLKIQVHAAANYLYETYHQPGEKAPIDESLEEHIDDILDPQSDYKWGAYVFKRSLEIVNWEKSIFAKGYVVRALHDNAFDKIIEKANGKKIENRSPAFITDAVCKIADLSDLSMPYSYLFSDRNNDISWCINPPNQIYREEARQNQMIKEILEQEMRKRGIPIPAPC